MTDRRPPRLTCANCGRATRDGEHGCPDCGHDTLVLRPDDRVVTLMARAIIAFLALVVVVALVLWLAG